MIKNVQISIIFVNYKTKDLTINAINSVIEKTDGLEYEIFVVDNNSQDGSIETIQEKFNGVELPLTPTLSLKERGSSEDLYSSLQPSHLRGEGVPVYIIKNTVNAGFGAANNLAIKQASGKYILCLNTDTLLINNAIKIMFDFMEQEENQNVGVCGAYLINGNGIPCAMGGHLPTLQAILLKFDVLNIFKPLHKKYKESLNSEEATYDKNINSIIGADIFFRKKILDEVGLFDEKFFMYREETDLCKRILNNNHEIKYIPDAKIIHLEGKSPQITLQKKKWFKASELYYFKKHHPHQVWLVKLIYIVLYLIDWLILKNKDSKELLMIILKG